MRVKIPCRNPPVIICRTARQSLSLSRKQESPMAKSSKTENLGYAEETKTEADIASEEGDKDRPRPLHRRRERDEPELEFDLVALQKRLPYLVQNKKFRAWIKQHYPAIRSRTELTPEIVNQFDEYDIATARERAAELAKFLESAFSYAGERNWPDEFRRWAATNHRIYQKERVTPAIMEEWREYEVAQHQAHHAKAEFEHEELPRDEYEAALDQWRREKHRYFEFLPNTKVEWAALMQRRTDRIAREKAEAERKAAKAKAEAAERLRRQIQIEKLKAVKLPPIKNSVPNLLANNEVREKHDNAKRQLLQTWRAQFNDLPDAVQTAWQAYHSEKCIEFDTGLGLVFLTPHETAQVDAGNADRVARGLRDPALAKFQQFNEGVRRAIEKLDAALDSVLSPSADAYVPHKGSTLDEIKDEDPKWIKPNVIPEGLSVMYGAPKEGKSLWAQKLSACVAAGLPFDDVEVAHGRVLYVTVDPGARKPEFKRHQNVIHERLDIPHNENLIVADDPVILNDPISVDAFLEQHPGRFGLVVIDPLYQCMSGSAAQDLAIMDVGKGLLTIMRKTGAAILLIHHEPRNSQHLFGSVFLAAMLDAQIHVERDADIVTVKVELLKNGELPKRPFVYRIEDKFYLAPITPDATPNATRTPPPSADGSRYSAILALLPTTFIREIEARRLVEHLLPGRTPAANRQQWSRFLKAMEKAGEIIRRDGIVKRRAAQ